MEKTFDLIVIGTGVASGPSLHKCRKADWSVAVVDYMQFGGTCALRGCDMKKVLFGAAELFDWNQRMHGKGLAGETKIYWPDLMRFKRSFIEGYSEKVEKGLLESGVETFHGTAEFIAEDRIQVGDHILTGRHFLVATGARPTTLHIKGLEHLTYSDQFLELDDLPERIVFIGGGHVSFEFAHIAARVGSKVHVVDRNPRPLTGFDPDIVDQLMEHSRDIGINCHLASEAVGIEKHEDHLVFTGKNNSEQFQIDADLVVHGAGRIPNLEVLNLGQANIKWSDKGILVNDYLQSISNPRIYSAGDVAATIGLPITPTAGMEGRVAAENLLKGNQVKPDYRVMTTVLFTLPKIASVGLSEQAARELNKDVDVKLVDMSGWYTYKRTNECCSTAKIIIDKSNQTILGAHLISNEADELINHFASAIQYNAKLNEIGRVKYGYPSTASDVEYLV